MGNDLLRSWEMDTLPLYYTILQYLNCCLMEIEEKVLELRETLRIFLVSLLQLYFNLGVLGVKPEILQF